MLKAFLKRFQHILARQKIAAVFHGHAHRGVLEGETQNSLNVYNAAKPILQRAGMPVFILEV